MKIISKGDGKRQEGPATAPAVNTCCNDRRLKETSGICGQALDREDFDD